MALDRRAFLKSLGLAGATSLVSCDGAPLQTLHSYLTPDENLVPGLAYWYATVCRACPAGCGVHVRTREGRPVKLEGNPDHPVSRGALCARGQAFVQSLYGRQRIARPLVRRDGALAEASWPEALALVGEELAACHTVGFLGGLESGAFEDVRDEFVAGFPAARCVTWEPLAPVSLARASALLFGRDEVPEIDLTGADIVLSVGADFLDAWLSPVQLTRQWAEGHGFAHGRTLRLDYAGPRRNLTANAADRWHRLPATGAVAFLHAVVERLFARTHGELSAAEVRTAREVLERLAGRGEPGSDEAELDAIAERLAHAHHGVVLTGGADVLTAGATEAHVLALLANRLTGATGTALRFGAGTAWSKADGADRVLALLDGAADLDVLFVHGADPAGTLPGSADVAGKLAGTRVIALACERSATTELADVVLPIHHPLESWGDYEVTGHVIGLLQPVRAPLGDSRHVGDLLIELAAAAGRALRRSAFRDYVVARRSAGPVFGTGAGGEGTPAWETALAHGGEFRPPPESGEPVRLASRAAQRLPAAREPGLAGSGTALITPVSAALYDGRAAGLDWLLEVPDTLTQTAWEIPAELAPDVALAAGVADGDLVRLRAGAAGGEAELVAKAFVNTGLVDDTVALRLGGGSAFAREPVASGNVLALLATTTDPLSGELVRVQRRVTVEKVDEDALTSVMGSADSAGRDLYLTVRAEDAAANRWPLLTRHGDVQPHGHEAPHGKPLPMPHDEIAAEGTRAPENNVELQVHPEHRWGLVVDLDLCTGCGACVVACYAENNIPVVGREETGRGRELSWLRLEKHVFGTGAAERWRFLPVMCQHCDNAPCEPVCPVFASVHTADGLNAQVYNRCVGTRYCSNNCPYKVRRFNYFDYDREEPGTQQLNPDVTVRSRGVMEKCTFCVQRIREGTGRAKVEKRDLRDGEILPACVQSCPAGALTFGDFKRAEWLMSRRARDPRAYRLLDWVTNTRPGVVYLRKVESDADPAAGEGTAHG